ncbi:helix-turn-helix domain-containing protein [Ochrobactrum soli]|uniref:helix-turn-helix domain-containing protein n=1 Tax=Ochrobactrum soli TaxID=2448455 RepID=UPI000D697DA6|nr:AraC family transcriptional regulator [[Ochrobactrum] soli]
MTEGVLISLRSISDVSRDGAFDDTPVSQSRHGAPVGRPKCPWGEELADWQVRRIETFIEDHIDSGLRVRELGKQVSLSASRFSKRFKATFGRPPYDYVLSRRIAAAKWFLEKTNEPLCQIAPACGLTDQAHFSKVFKRHTGVTPKQWRVRHATDGLRKRSDERCPDGPAVSPA